MANVPLDAKSPVLPLHPPGAPLDPKFLFQCITANIICSIVFGERFDYKDRQFLRLLDLFYRSFSLISSFSSQVSGGEERKIHSRGRAGKRICLGEGIARNELFLFFTTILQNFSLSSPVDPKDIDLSPKESGIGRVPQEYQICFLSR
ncbi:hypothetical protein NN561_019691 [Cricetulus griseus]